MAFGESKSQNLQSSAASGNAEANKAMRDASAEQIAASRERLAIAKEMIELASEEADRAKKQAEFQKKMASDGSRSREDRLKYLKEEKKFLKEAEDKKNKAEELSKVSIQMEGDILALREKNKKVSDDQHKVNVEISTQMTGSIGKFKDMVEALPMGKIISQQANLGGIMEKTQANVTASLNKSFKDGEGGIQAYAKAGGVAMRGLGMAIRAAMGPLALIALLVAAIVMIIKHAIKATDQARKFSKQLGVAADEGARLQAQFGTFNGEKGIEAMTAMKEQLGFNTRLSQESADAMGVFMDHASMANGDLGKIAGNAALIGSDFAEVAKMAGEFASETTGELDILKEIASLSKDTVGHFVGRTKEMVKQAKMAKDMNLSLEKTMQVSKGLLDIESSIEAEMTAQLLTGKDLNFDAARQLALQGDSAAATKAITDQIGSLEGMDMIQLESLAAASGLSVGELQGTAQKSEDKDKGKLLKAAKATTQMKSLLQQIKDNFLQKISAALDKIIAHPVFQAIMDFVLRHLDVILMGIAATLLIIAAANVVGAIGRLGKSFGRGMKGLGKVFKKVTPGVSKVVKNSSKVITKVVTKTGAKTASVVGSALSSLSKGAAKTASKPGFIARTVKGAKNLANKAGGKIKQGVDFAKKKGGQVIQKVKDLSPKKMFGNLFKGKTFGVIKKFLKGSGILNVLLELAEVGMIMATDMPKREKSRELVRAGSSVIGSVMGGGLGSLLGPAGTFLGSIGGSLLGNWVGSMPAVQDKLAPFIEGLLPDDNGNAEDFIVQDNKLTKFRKDDIIIGGTNLGGGDQDSKIVERLDTLIQLMMEGKTIEMDGVKVAQALSLNNLDVGVA